MTQSDETMESRLRQTQPLIVLGMHRSGTSLTVRLLSDLGIHMGSWLSRDAESVHFQRLNRRTFAAAGSDWARVDPLLWQMESAAFVERQTARVQHALFRARLPFHKPVIADFFGPDLWGKIKQGECPAWGWKDPRTTLTFPVWLPIFFQARWLHILRNGVDVAISIHRRSQKQQRKLRNRLFPIDYSPETRDFTYCFHLWEQYLSFLLVHKRQIPADQYLEVRYEDLLANPEICLRQIVDFAGHAVSDETLAAACKRINAGRLDNRQHAAEYRAEIPKLVSSPLMRQSCYTYDLP
jgi:hypothetical protein